MRLATVPSPATLLASDFDGNGDLDWPQLDLGELAVRINGMWGWIDPKTKREYAIVGRVDGTSFVEVTDPVNPSILATCRSTKARNRATGANRHRYDRRLCVFD
jgi:hypothetical protein